jgi:hypothetical protein
MDDSPDEVRDEGDVEKGEERGQGRMQMDKGKGKQKAMSEESGEVEMEVVKEEAMDVNVEFDKLTEEESRASSPMPVMHVWKKSSMKPG